MTGTWSNHRTLNCDKRYDRRELHCNTRHVVQSRNNAGQKKIKQLCLDEIMADLRHEYGGAENPCMI